MPIVVPTRHVPPSARSSRKVLGIDLGGAASATTGYALLGGSASPSLLRAEKLEKGTSPRQAEDALLALLDDAGPDLVAIDAPLTLPPCLTCPSYCRGPGELCELQAAREMWDAGWNPVSQRPCEKVLQDEVDERPMPTMQLGVITGRAVAFARKLATRGQAPSILERQEVLEVYPRATLSRLSKQTPSLAPKHKDEADEVYRERLVRGFGQLIDIGDHAPALANPHVLDGLIAAYTAWLAPEGLEPPPKGFNVASGWIWFPKLHAT